MLYTVYKPGARIHLDSIIMAKRAGRIESVQIIGTMARESSYQLAVTKQS